MKLIEVLFGGVTLTASFGRTWDITNLYCFLVPFLLFWLRFDGFFCMWPSIPSGNVNYLRSFHFFAVLLQLKYIIMGKISVFNTK